MLDVKIRKRLGDFHLDLHMRCGARVTGLFGSSGSGKTTALDCIAGITRPDDGEIRFGDVVLHTSVPLQSVPARQRGIGYVFQDSLLFDHMLVRKNLLYGQRAGSKGPAFDDVVDMLELGHRLDRRPAELSGGERRRAAIGRALLSDPALLLFDEPLTGLDAALAGRVLVHLKRVLDRYEIPAIYVSHSISDIAYICDEIIVIHHGKSVAKGPPADIVTRRGVLDDRHLADLQNVFTATDGVYDESQSALHCRVGSNALTVYVASPPDRSSSPTLSVRANDIILATRRPEGLSARNILAGTVTRVEPVCGKFIAFIDVGATWMVEIGPAAVQELELQPGKPIFAIVKASAIRLL